MGVDLVLAPRHAVTSDELAHLRALGGSLIAAEDGGGVERALLAASVAVDALAGIGAKGASARTARHVWRSSSTARARVCDVVALDLPSGIDADTGDVAGEAVWADATVTLGGVKQGLLRFPAAEQVGRFVPRDIGIPDERRRVCRTPSSTRRLAAPGATARRWTRTSTASGEPCGGGL